MDKSAKKWLVAAAVLVTIGAVMFAAVMTSYQWDFSRLSTDHFETNTLEIREEFHNITVDAETADIVFAVSDDNICRAVFYENENMEHSAMVYGDTLTVSLTDSSKWYEHIGFNFHSPKVTVYLPGKDYVSLIIRESTGDITLPNDFTFGSMDLDLSTGHVDSRSSVSGMIRIKTSTGDINLRELSAGALDLTVSTGHVDVQSVSCDDNVGICVTTGDTRLTDIYCSSISSTGATGDISLNNVIAEGMISIERSTGDIRFDRCDAGEIEVYTDTGKITGSLLSPKIFIAHSDTGTVDVPETTSGGKCKINTDTGDIIIKITSAK